MSGRKIVGCCVHVATLIYYLSNAKYIQNNKFPGEYLNSVFINMEKLEPANNPRYVQGIRSHTQKQSMQLQNTNSINNESDKRNSEISSDEEMNDTENYVEKNSRKNDKEEIDNQKKTKVEQNKARKKIKDLTSKRKSTKDLNHYFLKLENTQNSCFSNVILQGLLSLGDEFFEKVFKIKRFYK